MTMTKVALALSSFLKTLLSTQYLPRGLGVSCVASWNG